MHQTIISPLHLSAINQEVLVAMMAKKITALSIENIKDENQNYPILRSMNEIVGSAVMLIAGQYLSNFNSGKGVLLGGISGVPPTKVVVIGADITGEFAVRNALALGASVKVFDNNVSRLQRLQNNLGQRVWTSVIEPNILAKQLKTCEVAIGALRNEIGRAPIVVRPCNHLGLYSDTKRFTYHCDFCKSSYAFPLFLKRHMYLNALPLRYPINSSGVSIASIASMHSIVPFA
jgi:alanine dehydrogenase